MSKINLKEVIKHDPHFTDADYYQYSVAIESWVALFEDLYPQGTPTLIESLRNCGLSATIAQFSSYVDLCLRGEKLGSGVFGNLDIKRYFFLLRYLKRFTWSDLSDLSDSEWKDFVYRSKRAKRLDRIAISPYLQQELSSIARSYNRATDGPREISLYRDIPNGAVAEGYQTKIEKFLDIISRDTYDEFPFVVMKERNEKPARVSRMKFVPKNYKSLRGICMEPVYYQFEMTRYMKGLVELAKSKKGIYHPYGRIVLDDAQHSRDLAVRGSCDGSIATIDLSAASDSITYRVAYATTPKWLWPAFELLSLETSYTSPIDGKQSKTKVSMLSTMGSRLTMICQSHIYWVITCLAVTLCFPKAELEQALNKCSIHGDDITLPTEAAQTCMDILSALGFIPNEEKSFINPDFRYREACGVEAFEGEILSSCYWPRSVLSSPEQLISLYNRVYECFGELPNFKAAIEHAAKIKQWKIPYVDDPDKLGFMSDYAPLLPPVVNRVPFGKFTDVTRKSSFIGSIQWVKDHWPDDAYTWELASYFSTKYKNSDEFLVCAVTKDGKILELSDKEVIGRELTGIVPDRPHIFTKAYMSMSYKGTKTKANVKTSLNLSYGEVVDMILYMDFLVHGPMSTGEPLLDYLGISLPNDRSSWCAYQSKGRIKRHIDWDII